MMSVDKAIRLAHQWAAGQVCTLREGEAQEYHQLCAEALERSRWIPVTERLPEQTDPATFILFITTQGMQHVGTYFKGGSTSQFDGFYSCAVRYQVTHWMPLPNKPKED